MSYVFTFFLIEILDNCNYLNIMLFFSSKYYLIELLTCFNVFEYLLYLPLLTIFLIILIPSKFLYFIRSFSLFISFIIFFFSLIIWINFDNFSNEFQNIIFYPWFSQKLGFCFCFGLDGISIIFILLTSFLIPSCILISWNSVIYRLKEFLILLFVIEYLLINLFSSLDIFLFYIFFEAILIPMFLIIGLWGSRFRKIHATYQFFYYTLLGSILMLLAILIIYFQLGTTNILIFLQSEFSHYRQIILWLAFFLSFAVKTPMIPVHIWLPEAHVEAPTAGSVLLAGVLLKLGTYGILRFLIPVFPYANKFFIPFIFTLSLLGIIYGSLSTIRQIDLKKIIAYSSVVHMNFLLLGLFSLNLQGVTGSVLLMLSHGIVSSGLFLCVGIIYERYHSRLLKYYGGIVQIMPLFSIFFLIFSFANIALPGTNSFIAEFLIILGIVQTNLFVSFFSLFSLILGACYTLWLLNRFLYGSININFIRHFSDLNKRELYILIPLALLTIFLGFYPQVIFYTINFSILNILL